MDTDRKSYCQKVDAGLTRTIVALRVGGLAIGAVLAGAMACQAATVTLNITAGVNAVSHTIEKQIGGGAFASLTTLTMPTVQYVDSSVTVGQSYCYRAITNSLVDSAAASAPCCAVLLPAGAAAISCTVNP